MTKEARMTLLFLHVVNIIYFIVFNLNPGISQTRLLLLMKVTEPAVNVWK